MNITTHLKVSKLLMELKPTEIMVVHDKEQTFILVGRYVESREMRIQALRAAYSDRNVIVLEAPTTMMEFDYETKYDYTA